MSSSVKIREPDKELLDRLQAVITQRLGRRISQEELLGRALRHLNSHPELLLEPTPAERDAAWDWIRRLPVRGRRATREEDINRDLYGGDP